LLLALLGCGCGGGDHPRPYGDVVGQVVSVGGPLSLPGQPDIHPLRSVRVVVTAKRANGEVFVRRPKTDAHGRFRIAVPIGRYTFSVRAAQTELQTSVDGPFEVRQGQVVRVRFVEVLA
jgi:hypothetical protein